MIFKKKYQLKNYHIVLDLTMKFDMSEFKITHFKEILRWKWVQKLKWAKTHVKIFFKLQYSITYTYVLSLYSHVNYEKMCLLIIMVVKKSNWIIKCFHFKFFFVKDA